MSNSKGEYVWVPAAYIHKQTSGLGIYIKYGRNPNKVVLKSKSSKHMHMVCPDRELYLTLDGALSTTTVAPTEGTYDEYIAVGEYHESVTSDTSITMTMDNYVENRSEKGFLTSPRTRRNTDKIGKILRIGDSGGFQLLNGRLDYIDPKELIKWYNDNVDLGMVLDIPTLTVKEGLSEKLAKVQKMNTRILIDNKRPGLELINIFHGKRDEDRKVFREICETDEIDRLALGGAYTGTVLKSLVTLYDTINTGKSYKQYHILGVSNIMQTLLLIRAAEKGAAPLITSDSSTWLNRAINKLYYTHPHNSLPPRFIRIGNVVHWPNPYETLPCSCQVCTSLKYTDILACVTGSASTFLLAHHNMYKMNEYFGMMTHAMNGVSSDDLLPLLTAQLGSRGTFKETVNGFHFIDEVEQNGLKAAKKKFAFFLKGNVLTDKKGQMFETESKIEPDGQVDKIVKNYMSKKKIKSKVSRAARVANSAKSVKSGK